jgi:hypothetical protein
MFSDHTEDLPSTTFSPRANSPTISTIGSTDFTLEDDDDTHAVTEHPLLYFDDLVTIRVRSLFFSPVILLTDGLCVQVENSRFRIPKRILTQHSTYFTSALSGLSIQESTWHITDRDISAKAFENLLLLLSPPYVIVDPSSLQVFAYNP